MAELKGEKNVEQKENDGSSANRNHPENSKLSEKEKRLFDCVGEGNKDEILQLLAEGISVDTTDDHGMTPLQMAAYKANKELCVLLLQHGANANSNDHEHGYTALMFAALTGNKEVIRLLLEHGASTSAENRVNRTAAQMAAFVGQPEAVSLINNFFSRDDLEYFCTPRGLEKEPKLPPELLAPLYKYILIVNLNPIKLVLQLQQAPELLQCADPVLRVLDLLVERMMKQRDTNEVMAIKFHYLRYVVKQASKSAAEKQDNLAFFIKHLLKSNEPGVVPETQERFIRAMLKEFPYPESQLLHQMIRALTDPEMGKNPSASAVLMSSVNGQRFGSSDDKICTTCGDFHAKTCTTCKSVNYCNKECQKLHWFVHKKFCKTLAEEEEKRQRLEQKRLAKQKEQEQAAASAELITKGVDETKLDQEVTSQPASSEVTDGKSSEPACAAECGPTGDCAVDSVREDQPLLSRECPPA